MQQLSNVIDDRTRQFFILCARRVLVDVERAAAMAHLQQGISWTQLFDLAEQNDLTPLVFYHVRTLVQPSAVPAFIWQQFERRFYTTLTQNLTLQHELLRVVNLLNQHDISCLLLKGLALGQQFYPNSALRPSTDLDLLLPATRVMDAYRLLMADGYKLEAGRQLGFQLNRSYDLPLVRAVSDNQIVLLELHWNLAEPNLFSVDVSSFWARAREIKLAEQTVRVLSLEDTLLHLAIHMRKHRYVGLRALVDVAELVRQHGSALDWDFVIAAAQRAGAMTVLGQTLQLACEILDAPVPVSVLRATKPSFARRALLRPFGLKQNMMLTIAPESNAWTWLGFGQILLLDHFSAMRTDFWRRVAPPVAAFSMQEQPVRSGLFSMAIFYLQRAGKIAARFLHVVS